MSSFTVSHGVGRLVEARVRALATPQDVDAYTRAFEPLVVQKMAKPPVLCADHRPVVIYSPPVADRLVEIFGSFNSVWERVAILVARTNATLAMQLQRIVRASANPSRRVFFDAAEATRFLSESLEPIELTRLGVFLAEPVDVTRR